MAVVVPYKIFNVKQQHHIIIQQHIIIITEKEING
jgi:hypothetical protein